jgi:hypothetical protein
LLLHFVLAEHIQELSMEAFAETQKNLQGQFD